MERGHSVIYMNKKGKILVCGSAVIDNILGKASSGGTAGNISYGLSLLHMSPMLFSLVGSDFKKFGAKLKRGGVDMRLAWDKKKKTANFISVVNKTGERIETWRPNAYSKIHQIPLRKKVNKEELENTAIGIFSPGTPKSTERHLAEFRQYNQGGLAIFDPGQMITFYDKKTFACCMGFSDILILNALEYSQIKKILGADPAKMFKNKIIIKTEGEKGSVILKGNKTTKVSAVKPKVVLDTTGAGDAYRVGLIYGLTSGKTLKQSCQLGARISSKCIEFVGCQEYKI